MKVKCEVELSEEDIRVAKMVAQGFTDKEISVQIDRSVGVSNERVVRLWKKLGLQNRAQLIGFAFRNKLVK